MVDEVNPDYVEELKLDAFLRVPVAFLSGQQLDVTDLVDYVANAAGGVHFASKEKGQPPGG